MADVYVVGSLNADHRVRVSRIPKAGETILGSEIVVGAGGKGANQAVAASRAGAAATMIGACGDDADGEVVRAALDRTRRRHPARARRPRSADRPRAHHRRRRRRKRDRRLPRRQRPAHRRRRQRGPAAHGPRRHPAASARDTRAAGPPRRAHRCRGRRVVVLNAAPVPESVDGLFDHVDVLIVNEHELAGIARLLGRTTATTIWRCWRPHRTPASFARRAATAPTSCTAPHRPHRGTDGRGRRYHRRR